MSAMEDRLTCSEKSNFRKKDMAIFILVIYFICNVMIAMLIGLISFEANGSRILAGSCMIAVLRSGIFSFLSGIDNGNWRGHPSLAAKVSVFAALIDTTFVAACVAIVVGLRLVLKSVSLYGATYEMALAATVALLVTCGVVSPFVLSRGLLRS